MKAQSIDLNHAAGRVLCCTIFQAGGKKLLAKGHVISDEDAKILATEGMNQVWVTELEEGEIGEDNAVMQVASEIGCGSLEIRLAAGGRANLFATEECCLLVDDELLRQVNFAASVVIATSLNFSYARTGQRVATVKSTPFAVTKPQLEAVISILKERGRFCRPDQFGRRQSRCFIPILWQATGLANCSRISCASGWRGWERTPASICPQMKMKTHWRERCNTSCARGPLAS